MHPLALSIFAAASVALAAVPAWAVNKCLGTDGKPVFQDTPCMGKGKTLTIRPTSGSGPAQPAGIPDQSGQVAPPNEAQRIEANVAASQKAWRLRELTQIEVPAATNAIRLHLQACEEEQRRIEARKFAYVQNLYGKTHAAQVAAEQATAASRCDTRDRELRSQAQRITKACTDLGGCQ